MIARTRRAGSGTPFVPSARPVHRSTKPTERRSTRVRPGSRCRATRCSPTSRPTRAEARWTNGSTTSRSTTGISRRTVDPRHACSRSASTVAEAWRCSATISVPRRRSLVSTSMNRRVPARDATSWRSVTRRTRHSCRASPNDTGHSMSSSTTAATPCASRSDQSRRSFRCWPRAASTSSRTVTPPIGRRMRIRPTRQRRSWPGSRIGSTTCMPTITRPSSTSRRRGRRISALSTRTTASSCSTRRGARRRSARSAEPATTSTWTARRAQRTWSSWRPEQAALDRARRVEEDAARRVEDAERRLAEAEEACSMKRSASFALS